MIGMTCYLQMNKYFQTHVLMGIWFLSSGEKYH